MGIVGIPKVGIIQNQPPQLSVITGFITKPNNEEKKKGKGPKVEDKSDKI